MANHNFNFKDTYTAKEKQEYINEFTSKYKTRLYDDIDDQLVIIAKEMAHKFLKEDIIINKMANETDIPEEFNDLWLIYYHGDNDFSTYFDKINRELAENYLECIKNTLHNFCYTKYHTKNECEALTDLIQKSINYKCKFLTNIETYYNIIRYYVAIESAKNDVNNKGFENEFNDIIKYFSMNNEKIKKSLYIGKTDGALKLLNNIKFDNDIDNITEDNFNKAWWNGDVSIIHIKNGTITQI